MLGYRTSGVGGVIGLVASSHQNDEFRERFGKPNWPPGCCCQQPAFESPVTERLQKCFLESPRR
eukprot:8117015-Pyramimonas_sp.AAC.1